MTSGVSNSRAEMQSLLQDVAGREGSVKVRIRNAARRVGISFSRARDLWYGDERAAIKADELEKARTAARQALGNELNEIQALLACVQALEAVVDHLLAGQTHSHMVSPSHREGQSLHPCRRAKDQHRKN